MIPVQFDYIAPERLADAVQLLKVRAGASALAGGHNLLLDLKRRRVAPTLLVDLRKIPELRDIRRAEDGGLDIGAMMTYSELLASEEVRKDYPALVEALASLGDAQVRNRATIGGSLAYNDPTADLPAVALVLEAVIKTVGPKWRAYQAGGGIPHRRLEDHPRAGGNRDCGPPSRPGRRRLERLREVQVPGDGRGNMRCCRDGGTRQRRRRVPCGCHRRRGPLGAIARSGGGIGRLEADRREHCGRGGAGWPRRGDCLRLGLPCLRGVPDPSNPGPCRAGAYPRRRARWVCPLGREHSCNATS